MQPNLKFSTNYPRINRIEKHLFLIRCHRNSILNKKEDSWITFPGFDNEMSYKLLPYFPSFSYFRPPKTFVRGIHMSPCAPSLDIQGSCKVLHDIHNSRLAHCRAMRKTQYFRAISNARRDMGMLLQRKI